MGYEAGRAGEHRKKRGQDRCRSWPSRAGGHNAPDPVSRPRRPVRLSGNRYATDRDRTREMPLVVPRDQRNHFLPPVMTTVFPSGYSGRGFQYQPRHLEYRVYRLAILVNPRNGCAGAIRLLSPGMTRRESYGAMRPHSATVSATATSLPRFARSDLRIAHDGFQSPAMTFGKIDRRCRRAPGHIRIRSASVGRQPLQSYQGIENGARPPLGRGPDALPVSTLPPMDCF